ncbi:App1 family protein [Salinimicrobium xinjiangense]|uniref:App1 family protein n=1 Tax=Salinimicrobium xinjiangense TaxID=438596 RepID=UPI00040A9AC9|nr:phosphatase domain-containing protein [Salinimicrobium xinjiangense]
MRILSRLKDHLTAKPEVKLATYHSYGTASHLYLLGRAIDDDKLQMHKDQSFLRTLANTYKQFDSYEIPGAEVALLLPNGEVLKTETNAAGYFLFDKTISLNLRDYADDEGWVKLHVSFAGEVPNSIITNGNNFEAELLIPPKKASFGVISDIDDTILHTGVTSFLKWRLIKNSLFKNAHHRISLEGSPKFYRDLHDGKTGDEKNPMIYLSNSPWNLYQYLCLFLKINGFPKGPILLRHFRTPFDKTLRPEKPHKQKEIINILKTYPHLNFILIGDSGEHDPAIYTDIAAQYPDRILAIYLRSVNHRRQMKRVHSIVDNFETVPVLMVETSKQAEEHAREMGFIK